MSDQTEVDAAPGNQSNVPKYKVKYDWYQTESHLTINILIKNMNDDKVKIIFGDKSVNVNLPEEELTLALSKTIVPSKSIYRIKPTKVEVKMKKLNEELWIDLEAAKNAEPKEVPALLTRRNWDKLVESELKDDASQGEAALNELFQKIYSEGSDEVKKAMNKSFLESGGTVLSTNWNEVGEKKVDIKPPDGMEWKKWDEP